MAINQTIRRTSTYPSEIAVRHSARFIRKVANTVQFGGPPASATKGPIAPKAVPPAYQAVGLVLMDSSLNPISCNDEAIRILSYPDVPENVRRLDVFLTDTIRAQLLSRDSPQHSRFVTEFVSGKRRYRCRVFHLNRHVRGPSQPVLELLLERSFSGSLSLARAVQQFSFSPREQQAVGFLMQGLSSKEIADRMKISPNTVNTFFRLIMIKMGVSSRSGILAKMITASFDGSIRIG